MTDDKGTDIVAVGYKNPPRHRRFQPGRSGNPKGRPKKPPALQDDLESELNEQTEGETRQRAVIKRLVNLALAGDLRAIAMVIDLSANKFAEIEPIENSEMPGEDVELLEGYVAREIRRRQHNEVSPTDDTDEPPESD